MFSIIKFDMIDVTEASVGGILDCVFDKGVCQSLKHCILFFY